MTVMNRGASMHPTSIFFGMENGLRVSGSVKGRVIEISPVIRTPWGPNFEITPPMVREGLDHFRIVVSGTAPRGVIGSRTSFSFECHILPQRDEEPYDVRFFFESVEWKDASAGWEWMNDSDWDEFVAERMEGGWPKPIEFLGIARYVDGPSGDEHVRDFQPSGEPVLACWYRLPPPKKRPEIVYSV